MEEAELKLLLEKTRKVLSKYLDEKYHYLLD